MTTLFFSSEAPPVVSWSEGEAGGVPVLFGLSHDKKLCRVSFLEKKKPAAILKTWQKEWPKTKFIPSPRLLRVNQSTPILLVGSDFQHRVWAALLDVPAGETITYGELGKRIGKPKAARAVGTALGANPVPVFVPCHRVLAAGGIGGFSSGLTIKRFLLENDA